MLVEREHQNGGGIEFVTSFLSSSIQAEKLTFL
jgi:hypothetical protein